MSGEWKEIEKIKDELYSEFCQKHNYEESSEEAEEKFNELFSKVNNLNYTVHPSAIYTSRLLEFKNLPEPKNSLEANEEFYLTHNSNKQEKGEVCSVEEIDFGNLNLEKTKFEEEKVISSGLTKEIGDLSVRSKRQLSFSSQNELLPQSKLTRLVEIVETMNIDKEQELQTELMEITASNSAEQIDDNQNWQNIHRNFTNELNQSWTNLNFTYSQTKTE